MYKFKKDSYTRNRGGTSVLLKLNCRRCKNLICIYQKDGPGNLYRLYCDRIVYPKSLVENVTNKNIKNLENLCCEKCNGILAVPMIYEKEKRLALRLFADAIEKTKITIKDFENIKSKK